MNGRVSAGAGAGIRRRVWPAGEQSDEKKGPSPNFDELDRAAKYVCLTGALDAAVWGAELALGDGRGRVYAVEPTGPVEDDPNLTDKRYPGTPTKSYRSEEPLRVTGEVTDWRGRSPEALEAMRDGLEELRRCGIGPVDD